MKYFAAALLTIALGLSLNAEKTGTGTAGLVEETPAYYFERTLPRKLEKDEWACLSLLYPDGKIRDLGCFSFDGWKSDNDKLAIFVFLNPSRSAIIVLDPSIDPLFSFGGYVVDYGFPERDGFAPSAKEKGKADDYMIRFSTDGYLIPGDKPRGSNYDLIITAKKVGKLDLR